jgi:polar amino acid transport system substrate-binding protein
MSHIKAVFVLVILILSTVSAQVTLEEIQERGFARLAIANEIPTAYIDTSGETTGFTTEIAKAVLSRLGVDEVQWVVVPFASLIPGLQANRFDIAAADMYITAERCTQVIFSEPTSSWAETLIVAAGNPKGITGYEDFATRDDVTVAILAGSYHFDILTADLGVPEDRIVTFQNNPDAVAAIVAGRADGFATPSLGSEEILDNNGKTEILPDFELLIGDAPSRNWGGYAFHQGSTEFRDAFNTELKAFQETDEWRGILTSYGMPESDINAIFETTTADICGAE